jgi:CzcA family heavy metal efflux pump
MLRRLVEFSLEFRGVTVTLACLLFSYGVFAAFQAKLDVFPEFAPPQVVVMTEAPGLSPEEVEALVTTPVERAMIGVGDLQTIRSQSIQGFSVITASFLTGTDILRARQLVGERLLEAAPRLPEGIAPPTMAPLTSATSTTLIIGLTSAQRSAMELRTFADWTLQPRLLGVPGVAKAVIFGGDVRQLQIQVRPDRLLAYDLAITDVLEAARNATGVRGAGFVDTGPQRVVLRTRGQALTPTELASVVVGHHNGLSIRLEDVARVAEAAAPKIGAASIGGHPGIIVAISSQYGANTMEVTRAVERALAELVPTIRASGIVLHPALFRPANFVTTAIDNMRSSLLLGAVFVGVVLILFLLDLRTALITFTAIPLSLLAAVIALTQFGASLNTLTLGGLVIAIGIVVDDAIIDVENVWRRLGTSHVPHASMALQVVRDAVLEVRTPVVYATFVIIIIFVPVLTLSGVEGRLFAPLAAAAILAILASLVVAVTVTPALCLLLLARVRRRPEPRYIRVVKDYHQRWLGIFAQRPIAVIGTAAALCLAAVATLPFFGSAFLPEFREGHFIVHMVAVPGTSLEESLRLGDRVTAALLEDPDVRSVGQRAGRAGDADDTNGPHYSEFEVDLKPLSAEATEQLEARMRRRLSEFAGVSFAIKPFLTERIEETVAGATAPVVVKIFGDDLDMLDQKAREVAGVLSQVAGAEDVQVQSSAGVPTIIVQLRRDRLTQFGFRPVEVLDVVQTAYQGRVAAQTYEGNRVYDITVILDAAARRDPELLGALVLRRPDGGRLPLAELAHVYSTTGRYSLFHDGAHRVQLVTANVGGSDIGAFVAQARQKIGQRVAFPPGVYTVFAGAAQAQAVARQQLLLHSTIAGVGIVLLLAVVLRSGRTLLLVLANTPFALVGGVLAVFATGGLLSLGSLVGFVTLFGITIRNSILLVSHYHHLVSVEGLDWGLETALRGAEERLVPILMTALVTAFGLLPLALGSGEAGREIEGPMAIVILGGLLTSTVLNLLVLPTLALRFGQFQREAERVA